MSIDRSREKMSSRERVVRTFRHEIPDRVPIDIVGWNSTIYERIKQHFGLTDQTFTQFLDWAGVDFRGVGPRYTGKRLHAELPNRQVDPQYGWHTRWVENPSGGYYDYCDFPLEFANVDEVRAWPFPSPDDFDYAGVAAQCAANRKYALYVGGAGLACIMNTAGFLRGMEQMFVDLATDDEAGLLLIDKLLDQQYEVTERTLEAANGEVDFMWIGEDLGSQDRPLIGMQTFNKHILPRHRKFLDLAKRYGLPTLMHTCGSSSWSYESYIAAGLSGVDTLQPEAKNMDPAYLAATFGGRLAFHGCISTTGPLAYGTPADVREQVRYTLDTLMPVTGYCLSPTHSIQDNTPVENVIAMIEAAHELGYY